MRLCLCLCGVLSLLQSGGFYANGLPFQLEETIVVHSDEHRYIDAVQRGEINPYIDLETFLGVAKEAKCLLSASALKALNDLKLHKIEDGYLLFRSLPTDIHLSPTPGDQDFFPPVKDSFVSEFCLSLFATVLGEPFNYIQEERGNIFRNVKPTRKNAEQQTSDGFKADLELHTETAFHSFRPDYLLLYCLRGDRGKRAFTLASSIKKIMQQLDSHTITELRKPQYQTAIDVSFGNEDRTRYLPEPLAILGGSDSDPTIVYDLDFMTGLGEKAQDSLDRLKQAVLAVQKAILLEPGDLLILDNRRIVHGRTAYEPVFDGCDRWLQRVYVSENDEFAKNVSLTGRVVTQEF